MMSLAPAKKHDWPVLLPAKTNWGDLSCSWRENTQRLEVLSSKLMRSVTVILNIIGKIQRDYSTLELLADWWKGIYTFLGLTYRWSLQLFPTSSHRDTLLSFISCIFLVYLLSFWSLSGFTASYFIIAITKLKHELM